MTEHTAEEKKEVWKEANSKYKEVIAQREEIMAAFAAKYGCEPDDMVQVEQRNDNTLLWFVVRKQDCIYCSRCQEAIANGQPRIME